MGCLSWISKHGCRWRYNIVMKTAYKMYAKFDPW